MGKILRLTLDGKPAPAIRVPEGRRDQHRADRSIGELGSAAKAPVRTVKIPAPNLTPAETWSTGHRNPYGLAFDAEGRLWETEMGPQGGDELNLIEPGRNYGWPVVSYGKNYDDTPIPRMPGTASSRSPPCTGRR